MLEYYAVVMFSDGMRRGHRVGAPGAQGRRMSMTPMEALPEFLQRGRRAEEEVAVRLLAQGARILVHGYRRKCGEIDLIVEEDTPKGTELVFVEVRVRTRGSAWQSGLESVNGRKRKRLELAARLFLREYKGRATSVRWDVAAFDGERWEYVKRAW